jgi:hypothetical protein
MRERHVLVVRALEGAAVIQIRFCEFRKLLVIVVF